MDEKVTKKSVVRRFGRCKKNQGEEALFRTKYALYAQNAILVNH
jgi:hypothetical protein